MQIKGRYPVKQILCEPGLECCPWDLQKRKAEKSVLGQRLHGGSIFGGGHSCDLLELSGKVVDGAVAQSIRNLGEVKAPFPDHLPGGVNF